MSATLPSFRQQRGTVKFVVSTGTSYPSLELRCRNFSREINCIESSIELCESALSDISSTYIFGTSLTH